MNEKKEDASRASVDAKIDAATPALVVPGVVAIPMSEIKISYSRSAGPGGQNVNKTSSKARLRWKLNPELLASDAIERFKRLYPSWVTNDDEVVIYNQEYRDAPKNKEACLDKLRAAILEASRVPKERKATKPTRGSIERRLDEKKRLSRKKRDRGRRDFD